MAIGFKTYIYTPEADNLLLDRLSNANLRYFKAVVVEAGFPWGARGNRQPLPGSMSGTLPTMRVEEEISYYIDWVHTSFPETPIILYGSLRVKVLVVQNYIQQLLYYAINPGQLFWTNENFATKPQQTCQKVMEKVAR